MLSQKIMKGYQEYRSFMEQHPRVYLYGAGKGAEQMMEFFGDLGLRRPDGVIVGDGQAHAASWQEMPVHALSKVSIQLEDGIIVTLREAMQPEICAALSAHGIADSQILCQHLYFRKTRGTVDAACMLPAQQTGPYFVEEGALEAIGSAEGTDKCSRFHDYLRKYEFFLQRFRDQPITLLELGIYHGQSLRMWGQYFPKAQVIGVDIDPACEKLGGDKNMLAVVMDLSRMENLERLQAYHPTILVDDASHLWSHQIKAFFTLWDAIPHGGVYILEDLETSFPSYRRMGYDDAVISAYDVLSAVAEVATSREHLRLEGKPPVIAELKETIEHIGREVDLMSFLHGSCVMVKA